MNLEELRAREEEREKVQRVDLFKEGGERSDDKPAD